MSTFSFRFLQVRFDPEFQSDIDRPDLALFAFLLNLGKTDSISLVDLANDLPGLFESHRGIKLLKNSWLHSAAVQTFGLPDSSAAFLSRLITILIERMIWLRP